MANRPISPVESTKKYPPPIRPNAHPYAIKTTSSALLSRSNSSPHSAHCTRHHYIPSPPSRVQTGAMARHRHSSSLSLLEGEACIVDGVHTTPNPLPAPPPVVATSYGLPVLPKRTGELEPLHGVRRAEMMLTSATEVIMANHYCDADHRLDNDLDSKPEPFANLPLSPEQWNTEQLTTYLETSFGSDKDKGDSSYAGILECVRTRSLTGRELLRLTDADLVSAPLSDAQRTQLLERSRTLRANVLRERTYVDSYHLEEVSGDPKNTHSHSSRSFGPSHNIRGASVSVDDFRLLLDSNNGEGALPPSPVMSLHRSNSVSDASVQRYRDLARMRLRRRGRVKGLVETWERASTSGSEYSASDTESECETDLKFESFSDTNGSLEPSIDLTSALQDEPPLNVCSSTEHPTDLPQEPPSSTPPPPYTYTTLETMRAEEEEPSIEELLASSSDIPLSGARAWEADFGLGETVKRIPASTSESAGQPHAAEPGSSHHPQDDVQRSKESSVQSKGPGMRRGKGSRGKDASLKARGRVVTAIFTGSLSDDVSEDAGEKNRRFACSANDDDGGGEAPANPELQTDPDGVLRALEESVATTRIQLEVLRLRLEKVEADTARQEAVFACTQFSDSGHFPDLELRQRRSKANERTTTGYTQPPENRAFVEGSCNNDVLEGWQGMSPAGIARAIVARTVGWLFPYERLGVRDKFRTPSSSHPGENDSNRSAAKQSGRFPVVRTSCGIIFVSFAICVAVLRRMGFGRWVR